MNLAARSRNRATFLTTCGALSAGAFAGRVTLVRAAELVRLGGNSSDDMAPLVYALKAGLFEKAGLDVQISKLPSGAAVAGGVSSGALEFGKSSMTTLYEAHERGIPFTLATPSALYEASAPYLAFMVAKDGPLRTGKDFNNALIAVAALGDIGTVAMPAWVEKNGGDPKSLRYVEVPLSAALTAVDTGRVAAAESSYPALATAMESGKVRLVTAYDTIAPSFLIAAWFTTAEYSAKHPATVRTFARVWAEAAAYTNTHHAETAPLMAEFSGVPLATIQRMPRAAVGTTLSAAQIQPTIDASFKYGAIKRAFPAREIIDANALTA